MNDTTANPAEPSAGKEKLDLRLHVEARGILSFALEHCGCPLIARLAVGNFSGRVEPDLSVRITLEGGLGEPVEVPLGMLPPGTTFISDDID